VPTEQVGDSSAELLKVRQQRRLSVLLVAQQRQTCVKPLADLT
jgi:hypothetical protein